MDEYNSTLEYLFNRLQAFHRVGATAYKPGLQTTFSLSAAFGNPHAGLPCIHIAGTNGKGSTAHTLAAVLQSQGYRTGLYTSPHLLDFNERIRVNGIPISHEAVVDFAKRFRRIQEGQPHLDPSFFELATVMAFDHFAREKVDIAVIETGLGGRLDSTNIITPVLSVITNISLEHTALLGDTRAAIATEKAGIIKPGVPVVIGESDDETRPVFIAKASECESPVTFAEDNPEVLSCADKTERIEYHTRSFGIIYGELPGDEQKRNANTILTAIDLLNEAGRFSVSAGAVRNGFENVCRLTGLQGRWQKISTNPLVICDTGHNPGAWRWIGPRLAAQQRVLHMVIGFVGDKDISRIAAHLPRDARYYFVTPSTPRAASAADVARAAASFGIKGDIFDSVHDGWMAAKKAAAPEDLIFVGGSNFVAADFLGA